MGNLMAKIGVWAFMVGIIIALLSSFIPQSLSGLATIILVVVGLIVGFLNVTEKETTPFLMASVSMMIALFTAGSAIKANVAALDAFFNIGTYLWNVMSSINVFVFPATIVVALKAIYALAKDA